MSGYLLGLLKPPLPMSKLKEANHWTVPGEQGDPPDLSTLGRIRVSGMSSTMMLNDPARAHRATTAFGAPTQSVPVLAGNTC